VVSLDFAENLRALAEVIVRVGLNLQSGRRLLIAEPYELQGVSRQAAALVEAVDRCARHAGLMAGLPDGEVDALRTIARRHLGPIAQQLVRGAINWMVACAPTPAWADTVFADLPAGERLPRLWADVFAACRVGDRDPPAAWRDHLVSLRRQCEELNGRRSSTLCFRGPGTDLTVALPREHIWRTAELATTAGRSFLANVPMEEIFTLPHRDSADGTVRVARPVVHGGAVIDGAELEFRGGRVVKAKARKGESSLHRLLATDEGAARLGEVALVPPATAIARTGRLFHHPLLDENALAHVALGEAYPFAHRGGMTLSADQLASAGFNRRLVHVDLPLDTQDVVWSA
jgi:aminopeptidase